jgi:hypothetical protein
MRNFITLIIAILFSGAIMSQSVGVGTSTPASSAQLDVSSTNKGFLPPRLTAVQRDSIASPVAGLIVFCTNCDTAGQVQFYNGNSWRNMMGGPAALPALGQRYRGGILVYVVQPGNPGYDPNSPHGLIIAPTNQSEGIRWNNGTDVFTNTNDSSNGKLNTTKIIAVQGPGSYAAQLCADLVLEGYDDWYLPSLNELFAISWNIGLANAGDYWTSTECALGNSLQFAFSVFVPLNDYAEPSKSSLLKVRAIRSF